MVAGRTIWHLIAFCLLLNIKKSLQVPTRRSYEDLMELIEKLEPTLHEGEAEESGALTVVEDWPEDQEKAKLGQIGGVAVHHDVYVFHRASRKWDADSFDKHNNYQHINQGPIKEKTVVKFDKLSGKLDEDEDFGENIFFLPHGLTIDDKGNFWMTDVARHQVFKFNPEKKLVMTLGSKFQPGNDSTHFCKPTDVAVASNGDFFVADGYCNERIMKFDKDGNFISEIGSGDLWIPHSLALAEDKDLICVADRENERILCYGAGLSDSNNIGLVKKEFDHNEFGRVFAIAYNAIDSVLYVVNGPTGPSEDSMGESDPIPVQGFTVELKNADATDDGQILETWSPYNQEFDQPHDVDVTPEGDAVFVGEISPSVVWKFERE